MARAPAQFAALGACFALSGFAALVYQTAWTREFAFVFGTSELAIAVVLAAYMAGLAVGSLAGGRLAPRVTRPVLAYGLLELGIAVSALAIPAGLAAARAAMLALFGGRAELPGAEEIAPSLFGLAASFLILMVPTAFMGATLPLLAKHAVKSEAEIGPRDRRALRAQHRGRGVRNARHRVRAAARARAARDDLARGGDERDACSGSPRGSRARRGIRRAPMRGRPSDPCSPRAGCCRCSRSRAGSRSRTKCCGRACSRTCSAAASTRSR